MTPNKVHVIVSNTMSVSHWATVYANKEHVIGPNTLVMRCLSLGHCMC